MAVLEQSVTEGADAIAELLTAELAELLDADMTARWRIRREQYLPRVLLLRHDNRIVAAALVSSRPATAALKIVDLWYCEAPALTPMLDAVIAMARQARAAVVKWEIRHDAGLPEAARPRGFVEMQPRAHPDPGVDGYALWLTPLPHTEPRYYAQSTEFTCGAVAGLLAAELVGRPGFSGDLRDRRLELDFWRTASNFPACEPIGLAVAVQRHLGVDRHVEVALDTENPLLIDEFRGFDREFRIELQNDSRQHAADLGVTVRGDRVEIAEVAERISVGEIALLLITQTPMHGQNEPHWITAHASDGQTLVVVQDPWLDRPGGETWVDAHDLPIRLAELDRMCRWGRDEHRGVVFVARE